MVKHFFINILNLDLKLIYIKLDGNIYSFNLIYELYV